MNKKKWIALICACLMVFAVLAGCSGKKEKYAAKINGVKITRPIFATMFNIELSELYAEDKDCLPFDESFGREAFYTALKETKNKDGKTYYDLLVERTLVACQEFVVNMQMAKKDKSWPSADKMKENKETIQKDIESALEYYQAENADEFCIMMEGVPLQDYLEIAALSDAMNTFNTNKLEALKVEEKDVLAFYEAHFDNYEDLRVRTVQVRHSVFLTEGLSASEKTALKATVDGYVEAYKNGTMTMDEIVALTGDKDSEGKPNSDGYYDVTEESQFVEAFLDWAMARETVSAEKELDVIETEYGYHIMQCTKIWTLSFEDDSVKDVVDWDFRMDILDKEVKDLAKESKYAVKSRQNKVIDSFVKQIVTASFEGSEPIEMPSATPKVEDAPASETIVGMLGEAKLWASDYRYFMNSAAMEVLGSDYEADTSLSEAEQLVKWKEFLNSPYKNTGKTYLEQCKIRALEKLKEFIITYNKAISVNGALTEEEIEEINSEEDSWINQYLANYGASMGLTTRDELVEYMAGMNVNEYKRFNLMQNVVTEYSSKIMDEMKPDEATLKAFYNADKNKYRVVTVRHIYLTFVDEEGNVYDNQKKAEVTAIANQLAQRLRNGDSGELLVQAWSQDSEATYDLGLVDLLQGSTALDKSIVNWAIAQNSIGKNTVKIFETKTGYEIVIVEGILDYDGLRGIVAESDNTYDAWKTSLETVYKNAEFQKLVDGYVAEAKLSVTEANDEEMQKIAEDSLYYEIEESEDAEEE